MTDWQENPRFDADNAVDEDAKETLDGSRTAELLNLRARCAADTMRLKRSTIRIPLSKREVIEMDKQEFIQYVQSTIENARLLVLEALERSKDSHTHIIEWSEEFETDEINIDIKGLRSHVSDRIDSINAFNLLAPSKETEGDFNLSKQWLEELYEKLGQRRGVRP